MALSCNETGLDTLDRGGGEREVNHQGVSQLKVLYSSVNIHWIVDDILALAGPPTVNNCLVLIPYQKELPFLFTNVSLIFYGLKT